MEIERKFLVAQPPPDLGDWSATRLEQGYVAITDDAEVRLRRRGDEDGATLTIKSAPGLSRVEEELAVDAERFAGLWPLTEGRRLVKTRHTREIAPGVVLELDVYEGDLEGLMTLEVEFADEAAAGAFDPPPWVGDEVTGDRRYANQALALADHPPAAAGA
jgi:CYTH domain-containing protein